jgi:secondary thiamine-phosphate synthase enzyme
MIKNINVKTRSRNEFVDITSEVQKVVTDSEIKNGVCYIYVPHTTAGVTINEGADPSVVKDIESMLSKLIPHKANYRHMEGNSDAHIKTSLVGSSQTVMIGDGNLLLGTWQAIFFCEFDGARNRHCMVKIVEG